MSRCWVYFFINISLLFFIYLAFIFRARAEDLSRCSFEGFTQGGLISRYLFMHIEQPPPKGPIRWLVSRAKPASPRTSHRLLTALMSRHSPHLRTIGRRPIGLQSILRSTRRSLVGLRPISPSGLLLHVHFIFDEMPLMNRPEAA